MTPSKSGSSKPAKGSARKPPAKERRTEILLEDMNGKMTVIAEGHQMLVERMDRMETNLRAEMKEGFQDQNRQRELSNKALTKRIDAVAADVREVDQRLSGKIDAVAADVREVDQRLSKKIDAVADEVRGLRADVQPRLDDHEARITVLEGKPAA